MKADVREVLSMLERISGGGEVSFEEVQAVNWNVPPELDPFLQRTYRQLQMFASDGDIRAKDVEYDQSWRRTFSETLEELNRKLEALDLRCA